MKPNWSYPVLIIISVIVSFGKLAGVAGLASVSWVIITAPIWVPIAIVATFWVLTLIAILAVFVFRSQ